MIQPLEVPWPPLSSLCCCMEAVVQSISLLMALTSSVSCRRRLWRSSSTALFSLKMQLILLPCPTLKSSKASSLGGRELGRDGKLFSDKGIKAQCTLHL